MERYLGVDVHRESCTFSVVSEAAGAGPAPGGGDQRESAGGLRMAATEHTALVPAGRRVEPVAPRDPNAAGEVRA